MAENTGAAPSAVQSAAQSAGLSAGLSFGGVADAYDSGRPSYPSEAAAWLAGSRPGPLLELGAGTGKLTEQLVALGHRVLATDPLDPMLRHLVRRLPGVPAVLASAERIPLRARSVEAVVAAQAFHWFDLPRALPEIARVLRPGGHLGLAWNLRDERIPWVKRLGTLIGASASGNDPTHALLSSHLFGYVESATFRFWQPLDRHRLRQLVMSRSNVALMPETARDRLLASVDELYDGYGRGPDGMLMPYVTHCYRAVVRPPAMVSTGSTDRGEGSTDRGEGSTGRGEDSTGRGPGSPGPDDGDDPDTLLIDFR